MQLKKLSIKTSIHVKKNEFCKMLLHTLKFILIAIKKKNEKFGN